MKTEDRKLSGSFVVSFLLYVGLSFVSLSGLLASLQVDETIRKCSIVAAVVTLVWAVIVLLRNPDSRPMNARERRLVGALVLCVMIPVTVADAYLTLFRPH